MTLRCLVSVWLLVAPAAAAEERRAIRAGRLVDVESGQLLRDRLVLVRGERIEAVLPGDAALPSGAVLIDLADFTVAPGLIDGHTHVSDAGIQSSGAAAPLEASAARQAFSGARHARATLLAGFTSVRDVGTWRVFSDVALRDAIEEGIVPGPRMAVAGTYVTKSAGAGDITGLPPDLVLPREFRAGVANDADEVRQRVRELLNGGADFIKIMATGAVLTRGNRPGVPEMSEAELRAAVETAALFGARVTAHAHGALGIKNAVRAGVQTIEHGSLMDDEAIGMMREHGTYLCADIYNGDYIASEGARRGWPAEYLRKNEETTGAQREGFRKAVALGVRIAYGTDSGVYPHGWNARQLPYMVRYGMTPMQALQAASIEGARNIGWQDRVGSIAPGKYADIVAVRGDGLADLRSFEEVAFVMKGGVVYKSPAR
jgi:imidazolonepropionase-like amidohydrolase